MTSERAAGGGPGPGGGLSYRWLRSYPKGVEWGQSFEAKPLFALLDTAAEQWPARPASNFLGRVTTFAELQTSVGKVAAALQRIGVGKGVKVGLFLPNSPTFIIYYFAILKCGGTVVNYNPLYTVEELTFQVRDSETDLMVTLDLKILFDKIDELLVSGVLKRAIVCHFPPLLPPAKSVLYKLFKAGNLARPKSSRAGDRILLEAELLAVDALFRRVPIDVHEDVAVLQYTGGTTGTPKGAMLTHANVYINVMQSLAWVAELERGRERVLAVLPFFHVFAMTGVMCFSVAIGAELIIMPRFVLDDAMGLISKARPTLMPGVPTMFIAMLNHPRLKSYDLSSLKYCLSGGAPLLLETKKRFEAVTGCKVVEAYGLSEASPAVTINPPDGPVKELSIGQPIPGTIVSLRDPEDPSREVAHGERGELCIKGPQVMKGYWKKPEETAGQFTPDGFLRTGDVATMDDDGFLYIVDRIKDLIICSGYNVYPRNVEEAISSHPAVEEVTVIGIKDPYRGEAPKAFVKLRDGASATADEILEHLESKISRLEMPAAIEFRRSLPKTLIGKLSKKELKEEEAARERA